MSRLHLPLFCLVLAAVGCAQRAKAPAGEADSKCPYVAQLQTQGLAALPMDVAQHAVQAIGVQAGDRFCPGDADLVKDRLIGALFQDGWDLCAFALDEVPREGTAQPPNLDLRLQVELQERAPGADEGDRCSN